MPKATDEFITDHNDFPTIETLIKHAGEIQRRYDQNTTIVQVISILVAGLEHEYFFIDSEALFCKLGLLPEHPANIPYDHPNEVTFEERFEDDGVFLTDKEAEFLVFLAKTAIRFFAHIYPNGKLENHLDDPLAHTLILMSYIIEKHLRISPDTCKDPLLIGLVGSKLIGDFLPADLVSTVRANHRRRHP